MSKRTIELLLQAKDGASPVLTGLGARLDELAQKHLGMSAKAAAAWVAAGVAAQKAASVIARVVDESIKAGDAMFDMSQRTGVAASKLAAMSFAAAQTGADASQLEAGMRRLTRAMGEAQRGGGEASAAFRALGVEVASGGRLRAVEDVLGDVADALARIDDQAKRMDLAQQILGRGGTGLLPMLQQGSGALRQYMTQFALLGGMTDDFAEKADAAADAIGRKNAAWKNLKQTLAAPLIPLVTVAMDNLTASIAASGRSFGNAATYGGNFAAVLREIEASSAAVARSAGMAAGTFAEQLERIAIKPPGDDQMIINARAYNTLLAERAQKMAEIQASVAAELSVLDQVAAMQEQVALAGAHASLARELADVEADVFDLLAAQVDAQTELLAEVDKTTSSWRDQDEMLKQMKSQAIDGLIGGVNSLFGALGAGNQKWYRDLQAVLQVYYAIRAVAASIKILSFFAAGGKVPMAAGGKIPHAAAGYMVPDGPRGIDSRLIAAMPGEGVIRRDTMARLERFLSRDEMGVVDPRVLRRRGSGAQVVQQFHVGMPVSVVEIKRLGEMSADAAEAAGRRFL